MSAADAGALLERIVAAHGGRALWDGLAAIEAEISVGGFLFTAKRRRPLVHARVTARAHEPRFAFHDFPAPGLTGELAGADEVRILGPDGAVLSRRRTPRAAFRGLRRLVSWDDLDFLYFGGYATWNYFTEPFLLLHDGIRLEPLEAAGGAPPGWTRLRATFPDDVPTHSRTQVFHFDEQLLLRRLDYTAEVVGGWAHAAHFCDDYRTFGGLRVPTRRRVRPILLGVRPLPGPLLVGIDVHDVRLVRSP